MISDHIAVGPGEFASGTGWTIKPQGACKAEVCVPLGPDAFDAGRTAERLGMAVVHDEEAGLWRSGPSRSGTGPWPAPQRPDLVLPDLNGTEVRLSEFRGLIDIEHRVDALFGVVNVPNVIWIDEQGVIVRPPEPGWPGPRPATGNTGQLLRSLPAMGRARTAPPPPGTPPDQAALLGSGQDRAAYPDALRDWVARGAESRFALPPEEVIARSQPRSPDVSAGAAHFELANHLWRAGRRDLAIGHFRAAHRLQPDNWTYKRQAWSLVGNERVGGDIGLLVQGPLEGEEDDWPFESDFRSDIEGLESGQYYPDTMGH